MIMANLQFFGPNTELGSGENFVCLLMNLLLAKEQDKPPSEGKLER
jgi:hypothetical protein